MDFVTIWIFLGSGLAVVVAMLCLAKPGWLNQIGRIVLRERPDLQNSDAFRDLVESPNLGWIAALAIGSSGVLGLILVYLSLGHDP